MADGPGSLRILIELEISVGSEHQLVEPERVLAEEMLGLVEPEFASGRRRGEPLHRRAGHGLEGAEVRMVEEAFSFQPADEPEEIAIRLSLGAHHELRRGARGRRELGPSFQTGFPREPARELELREQIAGEILLSSEPPHHGVARSFEVDRETTGELSGRAHLALVGAGQHLEVDVAPESFAAPQEVDGGEHAIHGPLRSTGHPRGQKESLGHAGAMGLHESARRLFGRERDPSHLAPTERRAVSARQRAGVGLHDAHELGDSAARQANLADSHRPFVEPRSPR